MAGSRFRRPALLALSLAFVVGACATNIHARERSRAGDRSAGMEGHAGMMTEHGTQAMMPRMVQLHERMAADTLIHQRMMADPELRTAMAEMMDGAMDFEAMHERMMALPADERQARMHRMMEAHRRLMEDPAVRERMMADPEMRRMMQEVMRCDGTRGTDYGDPRQGEHPDGHDG